MKNNNLNKIENAMTNGPWRVHVNDKATIVDVNWSAVLKVNGKEFILKWRDDHVLATCGNRSVRVNLMSQHDLNGCTLRIERVW